MGWYSWSHAASVDTLGHRHTLTTAQGPLQAPSISLWVMWRHESGKVGPWGPVTGASHPGNMEWGQAPNLSKASRLLGAD